MNMNLRELYLADNKLNGLQDSAQLGNLLKFNCYIQILDLRNNHILDSGQAPSASAEQFGGFGRVRGGRKTPRLWLGGEMRRGLPFPARFLTRLRPFGCFVADFWGETKQKDAEVVSLVPRVLTLLPAVSHSHTGEICLHHQALPFPNSP